MADEATALLKKLLIQLPYLLPMLVLLQRLKIGRPFRNVDKGSAFQILGTVEFCFFQVLQDKTEDSSTQISSASSSIMNHDSSS